jgi:hypothetical protein
MWYSHHISSAIDAVGELMSDIQYVQAEFHKRFGVTTSSPDFMLGVRRTFSTEGDTRAVRGRGCHRALRPQSYASVLCPH